MKRNVTHIPVAASVGLTRRDLVRLGVGGSVLLAAGCVSEEEPGPGTTSPGPGAEMQPKEAPMLAEKVEAGELPPLADRLPANPLVVTPNERVGVYGGQWNSVMRTSADHAWLWLTLGYENLVRWDTEWKEVIPGVAESFDVNAEGTEYTFKLREGMKWSDGAPFTAADITFAVEDVFFNEELSPVLNANLQSGGEPVAYEQVDEYTVKFTFAQPSALFLQKLAGPETKLTHFPRHYLEKFHADYNDDVDTLVADEGFSEWIELFQNQYNPWWGSPEMPTLHAWWVTVPPGETDRVVAERNPYYWKTDTDGNQLPYIDRVGHAVIDGDETLVLKAASGEIDLIERNVTTLSNKPVLSQDRKTGGYEFFDVTSSSMNAAIIQLNLAHDDPVKAEVFNNLDFRIGLSHAINRPEVIQAVYQGQAEPWQAAPLPEMPFYNEQLAKQYTEYDVDLANQALDRAGYTERDGDGFRLGPDGNRISFAIETMGADVNPEWVDVLNLVSGYWEAVGVDMTVQAEARALFNERLSGNQHDGAIWEGDGGLTDAMLKPAYYAPSHNFQTRYAIPWAHWYNSGRRADAGKEPPEPAKQQLDLYDQLQTTTDPDEQIDLMKQILSIAQEQFWVMGIGVLTQGYGLVTNRFKNVPDRMLWAFLFANPGVYNSSQFFIEE